jgi:hypothetical protein
MPHLRLVHQNKVVEVNGSSTHQTLNQYKSRSSTGTVFTLTTTPVSGDIAIVAYLPEHVGTVTVSVTNYYAVTDETNTHDTTLASGYGGGKYVTIYLYGVPPNTTTFTLTFNTSVKVSRFILGNYWSPKYNIPFGISTGFQDLSSSERMQSGDLYSTPGPRNKTLQFELEYLAETDKFTFFSILKTLGKSGYLFISAFPEDKDPEREQMYSIYGKLSTLSGITYSQYTRYTSSVEVEEF